MADIAGDRINYRIDIDGLSQLDGMKSTIQKIEKLMPKLDKSVKSAQDSIKRMNDTASSSRSTEGLNRQKRGYDELTGSIARTGSKIEWASIQTTKLSRSMKKTGGTSYFKKQSYDLNAMGNKMQSFGRKATVATAAITAGAGIAINTATKLQNRYKVITNLAVTGGEKQTEATKNVAKMQQDATKYSDIYGVSQKKIAEGYETLTRRGYTTNQALGSQKSYLEGAIASGDSYTDVVNNAASAIEQFGMKTNSVKGMALASKTAINQMAYSADLTAASFSTLGEALKFAGPDAHAAHQSLHTTVSAIGDLSNFGIEGSQAGTSMRQIYQRLTSPPSKGKAPNAMKRLGLSYDDFRDAKHELLPIQDIFAKLDSKMKGMSKTDKGGIYAALFGVNASSAAQALGASYKQVDKLDKKVQQSQNMNNGKGYVNQLSKKNLDTLQAQWKRLKNALLNSGVDMANTWMPALTKLTKAAADLLDKFQRLPTPAKKFVSIAIGLTAIVGPLALAAGSLMKMHAALSAMSKLAGFGGKKRGLLRTLSGPLGVGTGRSSTSATKDIASNVGTNRLTRFFTNKKLGRHGMTIAKQADSDAVRASQATNRVGKGVQFAEKSGGVLSKIGETTKIAPVLRGVKAVGKRVPILGTALTAASLIGINKHNAGSKIGDAGGSLAGMSAGASAGGALGGALGTVVPGIGNVVGAGVGSAIGGITGGIGGSKLGRSIGNMVQKAMPGTKRKLSKTFGGLGKWIGGKIGSALKVGAKIAKRSAKILASPFVFAVGLGTKAFNKLKKPTKRILSWIGKQWRGFSKKTGKYWSRITAPISRAWNKVSTKTKKVWKGISNWLGSLFSGMGKWIGKVWDGIARTFSKPLHYISEQFHSVFNGIKSFVGGIFSWISQKVGSLLNGIKKIGQSVGKKFKGVADWATDVYNTGENTLKGKGHATGGPIRKTGMAMVNEAGKEVAYNSRRGTFRFLGNGPAITKVQAGEHILNAKDTSKLLHGGLGEGRVLPGYAKGTAKLVKSKKKGTESLNFDAFGGSTKKSTKSLGKLSKGNKKTWRTIQRDTSKTTKKINKATGKSTDQLRKNTVHDFDSMQKGTLVQMKQMHKGMNAVAKDMVEDFYKIFGKLDNYAHKAMASAIKQLNGGIRGINTVLNKFGGGGSVLPMIHYAQGSKGPISKHTMAVVNDAKVGPRQEAIVKANGRALLPKGNDVTVPLAPGDEVLNGTETAQLQDVGALPHFAKGTGGLKRLITSSNKDPKSAWNRDFSSNVSGGLGTALGNGLLRTGKSASSHVGLPWNGEVWSQLKDAMSGGGAGGAWAHTPGSGWNGNAGGQAFGAGRKGGSHDGVDFSARLGTPFHAVHGGTVTRAGAPVWAPGALGKVITVKSDDGWQEIYQEFGQMKNIKVGVGDTVKTGQVLGTLGPLNGAGSGAHVHIGVAHGSLWDHGGSSTHGWYDVTKMHGKSTGNANSKKKSKNPALTKLVKSELGSRLKWVSDKLGEDAIGSIGSLSLSGGLGSRARTLAAALKKLYPAATNAGIAAVLGNWEFESGGLNPGAINPGGGASGLGQWLGGRKTALINYARRHHKNWKSAGAQLEYALHGEGSDSALLKSVLRGKGSVASLAAKFSNQWERGGYTGKHVEGARKIQAALHANGGWAKNGAVNVFGEAKGENEVAVNTQRPSADPLLLEAMSDRANKAPNSVFGQLKAFTKMQHEFAKMKESQTTFTAKTSDSSAPKKSEMSLRPQIIYSPKITITGSGDPKETAKIFAKQSTKDQRNFESMMNDFCARIMAAE